MVRASGGRFDDGGWSVSQVEMLGIACVGDARGKIAAA